MDKNQIKEIVDFIKDRGYKTIIYSNGLCEITNGRVRFKIILGQPVSFSDSVIAYKITESKYNTKVYLNLNNYPIPNPQFLTFVDEIEKISHKIKYPCAIKPNDGNHGIGVHCNIKNYDELIKVLNISKEHYKNGFLIEDHVHGDDYRITILDGRYQFAVKRTPPTVIGDGLKTLNQLIIEKNVSLRENEELSRVQGTIPIDDEIKSNFDLNSIPKDLEIVKLKSISNMSVGGDRQFIEKNKINKKVIDMCESIACDLNIFCIGIDYITTDISKTPEESDGVIIELNSNPQLSLKYYLESLDILFKKYDNQSWK